MARGSIAKNDITEKLKVFFGKDFAGEADRKLYIWANDGGERVQIAISMTCPKANIDFGETTVTNSFVDAPVAPVVEMTPEEEKNIQVLLERLGL